MWKGSKVYFASDRDERGRMNLYSYDMASKQTKKLTTFTEFDVKFPSLGDGAIVFENGGWIYRLDLASEQAAKIPVRIREDLDSGRGAIVDVSRNITNYEIAPDGSRALFGARGDVFTVPAKFGATRNLTRTPGVHERNSKWSPDGRWIAYISDASGEDEIWIAPQDGRGAATQITTGGSTYKYQPVWSPDSRKLMWSDRQQRLHVVDIATKAARADRGGAGLRDHQLRLVPRQPVGRLREARGGGPSAHLSLFARDQADHPGERRLVQLVGADLQQRRHAPVLRLGAQLQPDVRADRVPARLHRHVADLLRDAGEGHEAPVRAEERRGEDQGGADARWRRREGTRRRPEGGRGEESGRRAGGPSRRRRPHRPHRRRPDAAGQLPRRSRRSAAASTTSGPARAKRRPSTCTTSRSRPRRRSAPAPATRFPPTARRCSSASPATAMPSSTPRPARPSPATSSTSPT